MLTLTAWLDFFDCQAKILAVPSNPLRDANGLQPVAPCDTRCWWPLLLDRLRQPLVP
jgi:hypothetical protein